MDNFFELESEKYWSFPKNYKRDKKTEIKEMIFSDNYIGARKVDGAYYRFVKSEDGMMTLQGRSRSVKGNFLNKITYVPQLSSFFDSLPIGTCLLGEVFFPKNEGSSNVTKIMGCKEEKAIERQEKGDKLHYYIFDIWQYNGESFLDKTAIERFNFLDSLDLSDYEYVHKAIYYSGQKLWDELEFLLLNNYEGVVITKKNSKPTPGKRPARKTLKIKKEIKNTIDCFFTGNIMKPTEKYNGKNIEEWEFWYSLTKGKLQGKYFKEYLEGSPIYPITKPFFYGWAGSLEVGVFKDGHIQSIGYLSGLEDKIKAEPQKYKNIPIELTCMEILPTGGLRHAKFLNFRPDLGIEDCTWEKIFGDNSENK